MAINAFAKKLSDPIPEIRAKAAESLGKLGNEIAIPYLTDNLTDTNPIIRTTIAESLCKISSEKAIPYLCQALAQEREFDVISHIMDAIIETIKVIFAPLGIPIEMIRAWLET